MTRYCAREIGVWSEFVQEEEKMLYIPWDFMIQADHSIHARRQKLVLIKKYKTTCRLEDFAVPADHSENKKILGPY